MTIDLATFVFGDYARYGDAENEMIGIISSGIKDENDLFDELQKKLQFPDYFGKNWNALTDCLRDFHWTEKTIMVIIHEDIPLMGKDRELYLDILYGCVRDWKNSTRTDCTRRELIVVFPENARAVIADIAG